MKIIETDFDKKAYSTKVKYFIQESMPPAFGVIFETSALCRLAITKDIYRAMSELLEHLLWSYSRAAAWRMGCRILFNNHLTMTSWLVDWFNRRSQLDLSLKTKLTAVYDRHNPLDLTYFNDVNKVKVKSVYNSLYTNTDISVVVVDSSDVGSKGEIFRDWDDEIYNKWFSDLFSQLICFDLNGGRVFGFKAEH